MVQQVILHVALGLLAFVLGMRALTSGLRHLAGPSLEMLFAYLNRRPITAFLSAVLVTAALHSSSATTIMVVGMVEAGVMGTAPAIAAIIGANLGTTATSQLFALSLEDISPAIVALGLGCLLVARLVRVAPGGERRSNRWFHGAGLALTGFGLLFAGLAVIGQGAGLLRSGELASRLLLARAGRVGPGILAGALATTLIQSSTLMVGLVMSLADRGAITLPGAIHLVLGSNIGTAVPTLLAGLALGRVARRMAFVNLLFNVFGVLLFLPWLPAFSRLAAASAETVARQVANSHGLFNLLTTLLALPFVGLWAHLLDAKSVGPGRKPRPTGRIISRFRKKE